MPKILVVDDDANICELLKLYLKRESYELVFAHDGSSALNLFRQEKPDLVILDWMLPQINGLEVCRLIRQQSQLPILMLTARDSTEEKVNGLDTGADDYIVKPFDPQEVAARVRAHLRKQGVAAGEGGAVRIGSMSVDIARYEVICQGERVALTPKEVQLLHYLAVNANRVLSREQLLNKVWGFDYLGETRTVDMHIKNLREKIPTDPAWQIRTIYGVGYKLEVR